MDIECIVTVGRNLGICSINEDTWTLHDDTKSVQELTKGHAVVMGRVTYESLHVTQLNDRMNIVLTDNAAIFNNTHNVKFMTFNECVRFIHDPKSIHTKMYIIGGEHIYKLFIEHITVIHLTQVFHQRRVGFQHPKGFFFKIPNTFQLIDISGQYYNNNIPFRFLKFVKRITTIDHDKEYIRLSKYILDHGESREDRTKTGTIAVFAEQMKFDIRESIPILTTKRIPWKSCIEELLWFLKGDTNANHLNEKGVTIWDGNSSREFLDNVGLSYLDEGDCGANYSFQWRHFGGAYTCFQDNYDNQGVDQIAYIENLLKTDKYSRRIFLSAWNPSDLQKTVLPPCHVSAQFFVDNNDRLSCHMYQRSCDMFLGVPWNILSYASLTYLLAIRNNLKPGFLTISTGDTHIYRNHIDQMELQISRNALCAPRLVINSDVKNTPLNELSIDDFDLIGYFPHDTIRGVMST